MTNLIPYLNRRWSPEYNCWDFVREIYANEFHISLEPHAIAVAAVLSHSADIVSEEAAKLDVWRVVENPQLGDVALLGKFNRSYHVGCMITAATILHLPASAPSTAVPIHRLLSQFRSLTYYRHASILSRN